VIIAPLKPGAGSAPFRAAWAEQILPALREFRPEMVFVSAGFDAHEADELASLCLLEDDFEWVTRAIIEAACGVPVVSYLEGGYNIDALGASVRAHVKAMIEA
jgi:acetoin utilization deacetylase AcuC-like enzyme